MAKNRLTLQTELETILGSSNVYFQPPENLKMKYPCIVYELNDIDTKKADDSNYLKNDRYVLTLIHRDPENEVFRVLEELTYCDLDRVFVTENLYHYVFTLFY